MNINHSGVGNEVHSCGCIGPQNGQPLCPCRMRGVKEVDGRWVQVIDYGPVQKYGAVGPFGWSTSKTAAIT